MCKSKKVKVRIVKRPTRLFAAILFLVAFMCVITSCNVTRKVTTQSEYVQHGDTSVVIMTKTIESYDAKKNVNFFNQ